MSAFGFFHFIRLSFVKTTHLIRFFNCSLNDQSRFFIVTFFPEQHHRSRQIVFVNNNDAHLYLSTQLKQNE